MKRAIVLSIVTCCILALAPVLAAGAGSGQTKLVLNRIADEYGPVVFDHAKHEGEASGCNDCHHQHGTSAVQSCGECHRIDSAAFKRSADVRKIRACRDCHPASVQSDAPGKPTLKAAYHRACFRCHKEIGSVGKDPKGCTETCHAAKAQAKRD